MYKHFFIFQLDDFTISVDNIFTTTIFYDDNFPDVLHRSLVFISIKITYTYLTFSGFVTNDINYKCEKDLELLFYNRNSHIYVLITNYI